MRFCCTDLEKVTKVSDDFEELLEDLILSIERTILEAHEKDSCRSYMNYIAKRLNHLNLLLDRATTAHEYAQVPHTNKII